MIWNYLIIPILPPHNYMYVMSHSLKFLDSSLLVWQCSYYWTKLPMTYQHSVKTHTFSSLYVADTILKEQLKVTYRNKEKYEKNMRQQNQECKWNRVIFLTVLCGLRLAILRANSMAFSDGLQIIGVFGKTVLGLGLAKWLMRSKIWKLLTSFFGAGIVVPEPPTNSMSSSSSETELLWMGLRVSKHMIPSKQSSNPSLLSALTAWTLSEFVKI